MCSETLIKACEEPVVAGGVTFLGRASHSHDISGNPQENFNTNLAQISTWTRAPLFTS